MCFYVPWNKQGWPNDNLSSTVSSPSILPGLNPLLPGPQRPPSHLVSASLSHASSLQGCPDHQSHKHSTARMWGVGRATDSVRSRHLSSCSATKLCDLGSWGYGMEAARGRFSCEIPGCKEKEHAIALRSGGAIRWRRPGWVGRPEGGRREKKNRRETRGCWGRAWR